MVPISLWVKATVLTVGARPWSAVPSPTVSSTILPCAGSWLRAWYSAAPSAWILPQKYVRGSLPHFLPSLLKYIPGDGGLPAALGKLPPPSSPPSIPSLLCFSPEYLTLSDLFVFYLSVCVYLSLLRIYALISRANVSVAWHIVGISWTNEYMNEWMVF